MNMVYLAGPFFNEAQIEKIKKIENELDTIGIRYYSPRADGILMEMSKEEKMKQKSFIYQNNVNHMHQCDIMVAVIDDRDLGTVWEMGYFTALEKPVITVTTENHGLNVMLAESVYAHLQNLYETNSAVQSARMGNPWLIKDDREVY